MGPDLAALFEPEPARRAARKMAEKGGDRLHDYIVAFTPIRTGNLATSWHRRPIEELKTRFKSRVVTEVDYAPYVNYGTGLYGPEHKPYEILPKPPNRLLSWIDPTTGQRVYRRRVMHPGSEGRHMVEKGVSTVRATLSEMMLPELEAWKREQELLGRAAQARVVLP